MKKFTETNGEFVELFKGLTAVQGLKGVKFGLLVAKNVRVIQNELQHLEDASKPTEEFLELSAKINEAMNNKDEEAVKALEADNEGLIQERKDQLSEIDALMGEESTLELFPIAEDCIPQDITAEQIMGIDKIIE